MFTAQCAVLVHEFKLTLDQIYDLTPRQIHDIYFHKRDKEGAVVPPSSPAAGSGPVEMSAALAQLLGLRDLFSPEAVAQVEARLKEITDGERNGPT